MTSSQNVTKWQIECLNSEGRLSHYNIVKEAIIIGKHPDCEICLADKQISREHCKITWEKTAAKICDLNSTNGTYFQGKRQSEFTIHSSNQTFQIGSQTVYIRNVDDGSSPFLNADGLTFLKKIHDDFLKFTPTDQLTSTTAIQQSLRAYLDTIQATLPLWCQIDQLTKRLIDEISGLGPIEKYFHDPNISELMVNGPEQIYLIEAGKIRPIPERFLNHGSLLHCIQRLIMPIGRSLDEQHPFVDARIPGKARINAIIPPLSLIGPCLTIRKNGGSELTMEKLIASDSISLTGARFLQLAVEQHRNLVVAGGTDTGKTTLLNLLSSFIDPNERIITIEDTAELALHQKHVIPLEARPANNEASGMVSIRDLLRNALRMRPDRILVGECRGGEALDMLQAMNTGHQGCMTTLHANSARDALMRLETMSLMSGIELPARAIREQIAAGIHLVICVERMAQGQRRISTINEVVGLEEGIFSMQELFSRNQRGQLISTGLVPRFLEGKNVANFSTN
jgi:pilus assembly protein CpaF